MAIRVGVVGVAGVGRAHLGRARGSGARATWSGSRTSIPRRGSGPAGEFGVPGYASQAELLERARRRRWSWRRRRSRIAR